MATEIIKTTHYAGRTVYLVVWDSSNQVLDWDDDTFKALGSATTPGQAGTERTGRGGSGSSGYDVSLDLSLLNDAPAVAVFTLEFYEQLGGSPAPLTDDCLGEAELRVAAAGMVASGSPGDVSTRYVVRVGMNVTSTAGDEVQVYAWVEKDGQPVTLGVDDECEFDCIEFDSGVSQFDGGTDPVGPAASNQFEATVEDPSFQDDTAYTLLATVTLNGVTLKGQETFPIIGSA